MIETGRIRALKDDGGIITVFEFQQQVSSRPLDGPARTLPGMKVLTLPDGSPVNFVDEHTFKIVQTGEIVRRIAS